MGVDQGNPFKRTHFFNLAQKAFGCFTPCAGFFNRDLALVYDKDGFDIQPQAQTGLQAGSPAAAPQVFQGIQYAKDVSALGHIPDLRHNFSLRGSFL